MKTLDDARFEKNMQIGKMKLISSIADLDTGAFDVSGPVANLGLGGIGGQTDRHGPDSIYNTIYNKFRRAGLLGPAGTVPFST